MTLTPIVRKVLLGAADASLDIAGALLLPGAWPIIKGALDPVLDRLKERLGGVDITATRERAEAAAEAFENDPHLQQVFRSNVVEKLDALIAGGEQLNSDVRKLMLITEGNDEVLREVLSGIDRIMRRLDVGVDLSDESVERVAAAIRDEAGTNRSVRELAQREMGPVRQLAERQAQRLQIRAVELVQEGSPDRAIDELQEGMMLVAALLNEAPTDVLLLLQLGFLYKTLAQAYEADDQPDLEQTYIERADDVLRLVKDDASRDQGSALDTANLLTGMGNMDQQRGDLDSAIKKYRMATKIWPEHVYAWHDLFAANYELARTRSGEPDVALMRTSLEKVKALQTRQPGFGRQRIAQMEQGLAAAEAWTDGGG
jgi:tetratricopeptide (TPR) repeat protein